MARARRVWILGTAFALFVAMSAVSVRAQQPSHKLLDVLVFGASLQADLSAYSPEVRTQLQQHIRRSETYRPRPRPTTAKANVWEMVYAARESYERRLIAAANRPGVEALAQQYVDELKPCYEWEGFHDCPETEARFAEQHRKRNPNSPFSEFLALLSANRWLCAADAYEFEEQPQEALRARRAAAPSLAAALKAQALLIRTAAQEQQARGRCFVAR